MAKHKKNLRRNLRATAIRIAAVAGALQQYFAYVPGFWDLVHRAWRFVEVLHIIEFLLHWKKAMTIAFVLGLLTSWKFLLGVAVGAAIVILLARRGGDDDDDDEEPGPPPAVDAYGVVIPFPVRDDVDIAAAH